MDVTKSKVSASAMSDGSEVVAVQSKANSREYELNAKWESSERKKWVGELRDFFSHNMLIMENVTVQSAIKNVDLDKISIRKALEIYDAVESVQSSTSQNITPYYNKDIVNGIISASKDKPLEAQLDDRISIYHRHITAAIYFNVSIDASSTNAVKKAYSLHTEASKHPEQFDDLAKIISKSEWDILYWTINGIGRFAGSFAEAEKEEPAHADAETASIANASVLHLPMLDANIETEINTAPIVASAATANTENSEEDKKSYRKMLRLPHFEERPEDEAKAESKSNQSAEVPDEKANAKRIKEAEAHNESNGVINVK